MKKIKLLFAILAAVAGASGAVASNLPSSADIKYDWMNWDDEQVLANMTQAQVQALCAGTYGICLRAMSNPSVFTVGEFTLGE